MQSKWRQDSRARLDTCEKLENCFRQVFGDTACEAVGVQQQLEQLQRVSGGVMESENFWKELYVRIYRPLFFARASVDGDFGELSQGVFVVQLTRDQPPWKQPWWNASRYLDPAEVDERRRLLGVRFKYILLGPDLDQDSERDFALRERYRQGLTHFGSWNLANNWTQAFMVLHHDLFPWAVRLIIDVTSDKIVRGCSSLQVAGTRFMTQVMTELQKDELAAYPVNTYEYIYDRELAEGMASTATRLDWGVTNGSTKKRRGAKSLGAFDLRMYMMNLQQSLQRSVRKESCHESDPCVATNKKECILM